MCLLQAHYLLPQAHQIGAERIKRCRGVGVAVINGVDRIAGIFRGKNAVEPHCSKVFANPLQRAAKHLCDSVTRRRNLKVGRARRGHRPQVQQTHCSDNSSGVQAGLRVGNEGYGSLVQTFAESLVVAEYESLVLLNRPTRGSSELIPLKWRCRRTGVKEIARVQGVVAKKFKDRTVKLIRSGLRHDADLAPRLLAVLGAVGIPQNIEFPYRVDAQQLPAGAPGGHIIFSRAA